MRCVDIFVLCLEGGHEVRRQHCSCPGSSQGCWETRILWKDELGYECGLQAGLSLSGWYSPQEGLSRNHALEGMEQQGGEVLNPWWKWSMCVDSLQLRRGREYYSAEGRGLAGQRASGGNWVSTRGPGEEALPQEVRSCVH